MKQNLEMFKYWTQALHSICSRETVVRSVRVSQVVLNLIELLYDEVEKDAEVNLVLDAVTKSVQGIIELFAYNLFIVVIVFSSHYLLSFHAIQNCLRYGLFSWMWGGSTWKPSGHCSHARTKFITATHAKVQYSVCQVLPKPCDASKLIHNYGVLPCAL